MSCSDPITDLISPEAEPQTGPTKCCTACAFRTGSPERSDPYTWMRLLEGWAEGGGPFLCHEGVLAHPAEKLDGRDRNRVCAGYAATRGVPGERMLRLAMKGR